MASRFKSKLRMELSHSPQPFDQQALTVRLHFESRVLKNTRQRIFNSFKCWPLQIPFDLSPSGQGTHHFSLCHIWQLAAWGLGRGLGWRVVGRGDTLPPPSSAVSFFFRDLAFFGDSEDSGFGDTTDDGRRRRNRAKILSPIFGDFFKSQLGSFV